MPDVRTPAAEDLTKFLKDAVYVTIGLGVIAVQKAQVRRQELGKQVSSQVDDARTQLQTLTKRWWPLFAVMRFPSLSRPPLTSAARHHRRLPTVGTTCSVASTRLPCLE